MIGERVREIRTNEGIGAEQLAKAAGISRTTLHQIEADETISPHPKTVKAIADALGVQPSDLTCGRDQKLVEAGWWPPCKVRQVLDAIEGMTAPIGFDADQSLERSLLLCGRLDRLRKSAGLEPLVPFRIKLDTPEQVAEYLADLPVRDRSVADSIMHC